MANLFCRLQHLHKKLEDLLINCKLLEKTAISRNENEQKYCIAQYFCSFSFREMVGSFLINCLFKKSSEYFLFFAEWFDNHIGRGGRPSDRCDRVRSTKILSDLVKVLGGSERYF